MLALCTGLLPAAAAAAARDTSELLTIGVEIVAITIRMSFDIYRRMKLVEGSGGLWASTLVGADVGKTQQILKDFHETQVL